MKELFYIFLGFFIGFFGVYGVLGGIILLVQKVQEIVKADVERPINLPFGWRLYREVPSQSTDKTTSSRKPHKKNTIIDVPPPTPPQQ